MPTKYCDRLNFTVYHQKDPEIVCQARIDKNNEDCLKCHGLSTKKKEIKKMNSMSKIQKRTAKLEDKLHLLENKRQTAKRKEIINKLFLKIEELKTKQERLYNK